MPDTLRPIVDVAAEVGLDPSELELYGPYKAKLTRDALTLRRDAPRGKLVLVTAVTPTPPGEGKTTMTLGLALSAAMNQPIGPTKFGVFRM